MRGNDIECCLLNAEEGVRARRCAPQLTHATQSSRVISLGPGRASHTRTFIPDHKKICGDLEASNAEDKGGCAILDITRKLFTHRYYYGPRLNSR